MPVYTYHCENCKGDVEEIQKFDDPPLTDCPLCEAKGALKKTYGVSTFHLQGSGWAKDGY